MILADSSEDHILKELLEDRPIIAKEAKKIAQKAILKLNKSGRDGIDYNYGFQIDLTTTKTNNRWFIDIVVNMSKVPKWYHQTVCYVESKYGTQDYYLLRGLSINKPYYIKLSSHTLKRVKERLVRERLNSNLDFDKAQLACQIIQKGEIVPWMKIIDPRYYKTIIDSKDRFTLNTLFYTIYGCYLGYETEKGNIEFNTFLNNNNSLKSSEENIALYLCRWAHIVSNKKLYTKKDVDDFLNSDEQIPKSIGDFMIENRDKFLLKP